MRLGEGLNKEIDVETELKSTYSQEKDGNQISDDDFQYLEIEVENCGGDDYFILKTERFAFDNLEDIQIILDNFKKKYNALKSLTNEE